jgi:hypothetical protein
VPPAPSIASLPAAWTDSIRKTRRLRRHLNLAADGTVSRVGLALSGIGGRPFDGSAVVTTLLQGKVPDESALAGAAVHVSSLVEPDSDIGEGGAIAAHAAVANAVADAIAHTGARVRETPLRPATVWKLLHPDATVPA